MSVTTLRRGETSRNVNRHNSRNDQALRNLTEQLQGQQHFSFFYQYCGNGACGYVSSLLVAQQQGVENPHLSMIAEVASTLRVPLVVISHRPHDERIQYDIDLTVYDEKGNWSHFPQVRWRQAALLLRSYQVCHQEDSELLRCARHYDPVWGAIGRGRGSAEVDFSLSNMIRSIPGVRHLDVDSVVACRACGKVEAIVEASSDGMNNTPLSHIRKATKMTRRLACRLDAFALLIQHHIDDASHRYPVQLTGWEPTTGDMYREQTIMSWQQVQGELARIHLLHVVDAHR